jgi:hypothetical protein
MDRVASGADDTDLDSGTSIEDTPTQSDPCYRAERGSRRCSIMSSLVSGYPWVLLLVGLLGLVLGFDRTFNRKRNESRLLRVLALVGGVVTLALPTFVVLEGDSSAPISPVSLLIMLLLGLCLLARALKAVPITFLVVGAIGIGLLILALQLQEAALAGKLPMTVVAVVLLLVLGGVFAASIVTEGALDTFLGVLGWGPLVAVVGIVAAAQGLLIGAGITGAGGLLEVL